MRISTFGTWLALAHSLPCLALPNGADNILPDLLKRQGDASSSLIAPESPDATPLPSVVPDPDPSQVPTPTQASSLLPSTSSPVKATPVCKFGPKDRACWGKGFNVSTDTEQRWPITGTTVRYHLEITNTTLAPDGVPKNMLVVNGRYPGPVIKAQWGDLLEISVTNKMEHNGTNIHWHGFRQLNTNSQDGVEGVTECPLIPGETRVYKFRATQHGTSWYHSHFASQYGDGVLGPIIIEGPATANYDHDMGAVTVSDHFYESMYHLGLISRDSRPPDCDNGLIGGRNKNENKTLGSYFNKVIFPGKTYRLRLINTGTVNTLAVHLDGHKFKVIQADMVPIVPFETDWLTIHIGQRYDVVFTASSTPGNFWLRAAAPSRCALIRNNRGIRAIFSIGAKPAEPNTTVASYPDSCVDESRIVPVPPLPVPRDEFTVSGDGNLTSTLDEAKINIWTINGTGIKLDPANPTLEFIDNNDTSYREKKELTIYELNKPDAWFFVLIQNTYDVPHPMHLHGHDARILGSSYGPGFFTEADVSTLNFANPIRRDTYMLPEVGWIVIAFKVDNPGAWLFHCHIIWHTPEGMAIQFLERPGEIKQRMSLEKLQPDCKTWDKWYETSPYPIEYPPIEDE